eukprot:5688013-Prymnesium_polylepis.1
MSARHGEAQSPRSNCHAKRFLCAVLYHQDACADRANPSNKNSVRLASAAGVESRKNLLTSSTERANLGARRRPPDELWTRVAREPSLELAASVGRRDWSGRSSGEPAGQGVRDKSLCSAALRLGASRRGLGGVGVGAGL